MQDPISDDAERNRYSMNEDGYIIFADYLQQGSVVHVLHVEAPAQMRGKGAAGRFMQALMQHLRAKNLRVKPICSYAVAWLERHPEYQDMLEL